MGSEESLTSGGNASASSTALPRRPGPARFIVPHRLSVSGALERVLMSRSGPTRSAQAAARVANI